MKSEAVYNYLKIQGTSRSYEGLPYWSIRQDPAFLFAPGLEDEGHQVLCTPDVKTRNDQSKITVSINISNS